MEKLEKNIIAFLKFSEMDMKLLTTFQIVDTIRYLRESEIYNASDVYIYIYI